MVSSEPRLFRDMLILFVIYHPVLYSAFFFKNKLRIFLYYVSKYNLNILTLHNPVALCTLHDKQKDTNK